MILGASLTLLGAIAAAQAWSHGGWQWILLWPGGAFVVVGIAYLASYRGIFGKRPDGTLGAPTVVALWPFLALAWGTWHAARLASREPPIAALSPGLRIGRRLLRRELPDEIDHVVDLTAELREVARARGYTSLRILDGGVPDRGELRLALEAVPRTGITLVHCAQGHGRTALFAACLLIDREGRVAADAVAAVLAARPGARMNRAQRRFVERFARAVWLERARNRRSAGIYTRGPFYYFHSQSLTTAGLWTFSEPALSVPNTSDDRELGLALLAVLDGSRTGVPPSEPGGFPKPLRRLAGVKSWTKFAEGAEHAGAEEEGEQITLSPMRKLGVQARWLFEHRDHQLVLESATPEELGAAIRRVLSRGPGGAR